MVNLFAIILPLVFSTVSGHLRVLHEWKYIDYVWEDSSQKQEAINAGNYNATQVFPIDVDYAKDGRIFVSTPRQAGVPATLSTVSDERGKGGPLLQPYPDWSWYKKTDCSGIISVYRVTIDDCDRLWVLDNGKIGNDQVCPAQIFVFNLQNNKLLGRYSIPSQYATSTSSGNSLLITPAIETEGLHCEQTWIYMADVEGWGLVISNTYNLHRLNDSSFEPDKSNTNFTIAGESFFLEDGLFALALQPKKYRHQSSRLFYRPLASLKQYIVSTDDLKRSFFQNTKPNYRTLDYTFPTQVSVEAFSEDGILFMAYVGQPAIACWNSCKKMNDRNVVIVAQNEETLQFTSGLKVRDKQLWVMTNRFQKIMAGTQNFEEVNFRILYEQNIKNLVKGTACEVDHNHRAQHCDVY